MVKNKKVIGEGATQRMENNRKLHEMNIETNTVIEH